MASEKSLQIRKNVLEPGWRLTYDSRVQNNTRSLWSPAALSRRSFIRTSSLAFGATTLAGPALVRGQNLNAKINGACIGVAGKGGSDTAGCAKENIVALCDVDSGSLGKAATKYPKAQTFKDFRKLFEKVKEIDAVTVSTPDHLHAPVSVMAMRLGKHVFCQKPLTQSVFEARLMRQLAKEKKLATQMGNQGSAGSGLRRAVEIVQAGVIGPVRQLHVWSNRPIWPQGIDRPEGEDPVPETLDWDLWLGPAPKRPFKNGSYHPFKWRGWQDFGTGALGDMACHTVNMPFRALKLGYPEVVEAEANTGMNKETYPKSSRIRFEFPAREGMPELKFWWYDGGWKPNPELTKEIVELQEKVPGSGCLLVGDKGRLYSPDDYGGKFYLLVGDEKEFKTSDQHAAAKEVPQTVPRSPGHVEEWFRMIRTGEPAYSNFDIAAYLTEIILLGCIGLRVGKKMDWDGPNMKAKNTPEAEQFVKRQCREGWQF